MKLLNETLHRLVYYSLSINVHTLGVSLSQNCSSYRIFCIPVAVNKRGSSGNSNEQNPSNNAVQEKCKQDRSTTNSLIIQIVPVVRAQVIAIIVPL